MGWVPQVCQVTCLILFTQQTHVVSSVGPIIQKRKLKLKLRNTTFLLLPAKEGRVHILALATALFHCIYSSV